MFKSVIIIFLSTFILICNATQQLGPAITQPIPMKEIQSDTNNSESVKKMFAVAASLSQQNLTYLYGSSDPKNKGMDCSGVIHYLLKKLNVSDVPRDANNMYAWAKEKGKFHYVTHNNLDSSQFSNLKPGDLLFWSGTYATKQPNHISHVMIYLGKDLKNQVLMFGSSNGRTYQGKKMWGVSVFDFNLPNKDSHAKFIGYSCVPDLTCDQS